MPGAQLICSSPQLTFLPRRTFPQKHVVPRSTLYNTVASSKPRTQAKLLLEHLLQSSNKWF